MPSLPLRAVAPRAAVLGALAAAALAPTAASAQKPNPTILPGVTFAGVDLSGQTREQAAATLAAALEGKHPNDAAVVVRIAGRRHALSMDTLGYGWNLEKAVIRASKAPAGTAVDAPIVWDSAAYSKWLTSLASMRKGARDATVRIGIAKMKVRGSRKGWKLDRAKLKALVDPVLADPTKPRNDLSLPVIRTSGRSIASLRSQYGTIVTVDRRTFKLRLFKRLRLSKTYRIAVGATGHDTPAGSYTVTSKQVNPAWHVPNSAWAGSLAGQVIPGGASNNPLKARWIGLRDGIGIHGTAETWALGQRASHGCIRMHPDDVIALYKRVPMGTTVKVR
ncbi:L,D-transpeptidase family protein [Patulibacter sp. S7RM1-6]